MPSGMHVTSRIQNDNIFAEALTKYLISLLFCSELIVV